MSSSLSDISLSHDISIPLLLEQVAPAIPMESEKEKSSFSWNLSDALGVIAFVAQRLSTQQAFEEDIIRLNQALECIAIIFKIASHLAYPIDKVNEQDLPKVNAYRQKIRPLYEKKISLQKNTGIDNIQLIDQLQEVQKYAVKLRKKLFEAAQNKKLIRKTLERCYPPPEVDSKGKEQEEKLTFGSASNPENQATHSPDNEEINPNLLLRVLTEQSEQQKDPESRIGKFIRKHPVKAAAVIIFGCLTLLCVGVGIGLLSGGIGIAGILAAGISLLSVGPVYPVVIAATFFGYKAYCAKIRRENKDLEDRAFYGQSDIFRNSTHA